MWFSCAQALPSLSLSSLSGAYKLSPEDQHVVEFTIKVRNKNYFICQSFSNIIIMNLLFIYQLLILFFIIFLDTLLVPVGFFRFFTYSNRQLAVAHDAHVSNPVHNTFHSVPITAHSSHSFISCIYFLFDLEIKLNY